MTLATSLFGLSMLIHGLLRDYVSNGVARMEMYFFLRQVFSIFVDDNDNCEILLLVTFTW